MEKSICVYVDDDSENIDKGVRIRYRRRRIWV